jgi:hypothetical protein
MICLRLRFQTGRTGIRETRLDSFGVVNFLSGKLSYIPLFPNLNFTDKTLCLLS